MINLNTTSFTIRMFKKKLEIEGDILIGKTAINNMMHK
jgi:hypothetical protein